jgi:hypothetical protein
MTHTFELEESTVTVEAPDGAEFADLEGLPEGQRHLTWTAGEQAFFMVSASDGFAVPEALDSDEPAPLAGPGARRVVYRAVRRRPRRLVAAPEGARSVPEESVLELSDLLLVPGDHEHLRIGYRVPADAPEELRARLAAMLDSVEVRHRDA